MRIYLTILLLPPLIPVLAAVKTALSRGNYTLQSCIYKRQCDFVVKEGNFFFVTFHNRDGKNRFDFVSYGNIRTSSATLFSFLGDVPNFQVLEAPTNSLGSTGSTGSKIIIGQIPLWLLSVLLLIPFLVYALRRRRSEKTGSL
jgi:hypothetical protein